MARHRAPLLRVDRREEHRILQSPMQMVRCPHGGRFRTARAQRQLLRCSSREHPCKPPPSRSVHDPFKTASGVHNAGLWDPWLPAVEDSRLFAQRGRSARCALSVHHPVDGIEDSILQDHILRLLILSTNGFGFIAHFVHGRHSPRHHRAGGARALCRSRTSNFRAGPPFGAAIPRPRHGTGIGYNVNRPLQHLGLCFVRRSPPPPSPLPPPPRLFASADARAWEYPHDWGQA